MSELQELAEEYAECNSERNKRGDGIERYGTKMGF